ncbi:MAG: 7-cyano-7-deazaguanine synthase QueC [Paludibacteraceae bacterium]|nr:7-cyano-7-deazaguanine synthase QueC [Paludibacteraceae bacterium]
MTATPDTLIVLSGGMDSVTMLYEFKDSISMAVSFDYGSNHNGREIPFARLHCERLHIRHVVIPLGFMKHCFRSSLLQGADAVPEGRYDDQNMRSTVVPFRNGIMLSIAAGLAESNGLKRVMMANHAGDHAIYPDCRPDFVESMDAAISRGTYDGIRLVTPYTHLTKADIARRGAALGVDYALTWSCYKGGQVHCGCCGTCCERREALREAGIDDPTVYASETSGTAAADHQS